VRRLKRLSKAKNFRIVVFSDTHGSFRAANRIVRKNPSADLFIFLGDGENDIEQLKHLYPKKQILSVMGNCDAYSDAPKELVYTAPNGVKIFAAHGNEYSVGSSVQKIYYRALELGAQIVLFGHTHTRFYNYADGVHILNPGSAACPRDGLEPSYAFIDILENGIFCSHVDV